MTMNPPKALSAELDAVEPRIERLEAELEVARAVRAQLLEEQSFARLFPEGSGFVRT